MMTHEMYENETKACTCECPALACDCPSSAEVLAEVKSDFDVMLADADYPCPPWLTRPEMLEAAAKELIRRTLAAQAL